MKIKRLLDIRLDLFDGGGAAAGGAGAGAAAPAGQTGAKGETQASPAPTRRGSGEYSTVLFGKQTGAEASGDAGQGRQASPSDAGKETKAEVQTTSSTLDERRRAFKELVTGEYKDVYGEEVQRLIDRRFKDAKGLEDQVNRSRPVLDMLMQRYHIADGDMDKLARAVENDDAYWSQAAEEAGMSVEQYKQFQRLERENAALLDYRRRQRSQQAAQQQLQKWYGEAEQVKGLYPSFDLSAEVQNPQFLSMLRAGVPVRHAYEVIHMDEIKAGAARLAAQVTEKQVTDGIRARGARPKENGTTAQSGFTVKDDVSKLTKKDRAEIARRAMMGETITF